MIAVLGASGQLGSAFIRLLGDRAVPVDRASLDMTNRGAIEAWVEELRPRIVINCAAFTAVDAAESDSTTARRVNAEAVGTLARATDGIGAGLVTFSTDYVFDGTKGSPYVESDEANPLNIYGRTKLEGERLALEGNSASLVVRTSWLMSSTHPNFIRTILHLLGEGSVSVVDDQLGRPTFVDDLAPAVVDATISGMTGVLHLANRGETTWCGLAREIAALCDMDAGRVTAITTAESGRPATRPADSRLDSERLGVGLAALPDYRESLETTVRSILGEQARP